MRAKKIFTALALAGLALAAVALAADTVSVIVKKTSIRKSRQFFAPAVAEAFYRDTLAVLAEEEDWLKVSHNGKEGWIHLSSVSSKVSGDGKGLFDFGRDEAAKVSDDEVAMAGKGFSKQVEEKYRQSNPELNFGAIDAMERVNIPPADLLAFVEAGNLQQREGGQ